MKVLKYMQMATIVAALGFVSCNSDDIPQIGDADIQVIASIGDVKTRVNSEDDGSKFLPGDTLYITGYSSGSWTYVTENGTINGKAEFQAVSDKLRWNKEGKMVFIAINSQYISYNNSSDLYILIGDDEIASDQTTVEKLRTEDIIMGYYRNDYFTTNGVVSFNMEHVLSKVTVSIKEYNGFDNPAKDGYKINNMIINSNKITDNSYSYYHYLESYTGWSSKEPTEEKVAISPLMKEDKTNGKHSFTAIIAPNKYATGDVFLSFEFQGIVYKVLANTDLCSEDFIQPGKHYHFDLTINKKASVNMSKVSLIGWEEEEFTKFD